MSGRLTTHVLDVSLGKPAAGVSVQLWRLGAGLGTPILLKEETTNADGRLDRPLLSDGELEPGEYELMFGAGDYFGRSAVNSGESAPVFLGRIPIRFRVADPDSHYHIPLLVAPGGYSTYRGS